MSTKTLTQRLRQLAQQELNRSKAARLRDVIDDIELALDKGVSRESIVQHLNENGLNITLKNFDVSLYRARKKQNQKLNSQTTLRPAPPPAENSTLLETYPDTQPEASHDPAALDSIINSTPDLAALAKQFKQSQKKGNQK